MRNLINIINEANHCNTKFDDIDGDICPDCGMHKEWHRGLDAETMARSRKYGKESGNYVEEGSAPGRIHASRQTGRLMNLKPRMSQQEAEQTMTDLANLCDGILEWCENRGEVSIAMKQAVMNAKAMFPQDAEMCMSNPNVPRNIRDGIQLMRDELKNYNVVLESEKSGKWYVKHSVRTLEQPIEHFDTHQEALDRSSDLLKTPRVSSVTIGPVSDLHEAKRKSMIAPKEDKSVPKCTACNGSGYYDHNGSPKCSECNGTGECPKA